MKTMMLFTLAAVLVAPLSMPLHAQSKKYDIKSGIITFEETTIMGKMKLSRTVVVSFDDYGMKERRESYEGTRRKETFFSDGRMLYTIVEGQRTAYSRGATSRGTELRFDWDEVSARDKQDGKARKLPNVIVAGKNCESFEQISSSGKTVFAGWNHICLMVEHVGPKMRKVSKAIRIEENASVPAEKFKVPSGFTVK